MELPRRFSRPTRRKARGFVADLAFRLGGSPRLRKHSVQFLKTLSVGVGYAAFIEPLWVEITQLDIPVPGLPSALDGYRIAHLTDIHYNFTAGRVFLESIVEWTNSLDPDVVCLTGDFIGHKPGNLHRCFSLLSDLRAPDGLWATRGNHDHRATLADFRLACRDAGVRFLENQHAVIRPSRCRVSDHQFPEYGEACSPIVLAGLGDLWEGICSPGMALEGANPALPTVIMSHNPQAAELMLPGQRSDIMLSGHTHGGQVRLFGRTFKIFSDGTLKYVSGLIETPHTPVYVSRGVGTSAFRLRWNCRPEIALIRLVRDHNPLGGSEPSVTHTEAPLGGP